MNYLVSEIFDTVSGEAPTQGEECTFVRLSYCPVRCKSCDTWYSVAKDSDQYALGYLKAAAQTVAEYTTYDGGRMVFRLDTTNNDFARGVQRFAEQLSNHRPAKVRKTWRRLHRKPEEPTWVCNMVHKKFGPLVDKLGSPPVTWEESRGYTAGVFDAVGERNRKRQTRIQLTTRHLSVMEVVEDTLDFYSIKHSGIQGPLIKAHHPHKYDICISDWDKFNAQRFYDVFQPRTQRFYGSVFDRRGWTQHRELDVSSILPRVHKKLCIISGGEPLVNNLDGLIRGLRDSGHIVQIETSGAYDFKGTERPDILVCSPKPNMSYHIAPTVQESTTIFKLVAGPSRSGFDWDGELAARLHDSGTPVYVMDFGAPPTEESKAYTQRILKEHPEYEYSSRLHYELGVR